MFCAPCFLFDRFDSRKNAKQMNDDDNRKSERRTNDDNASKLKRNDANAKLTR